MKYAILFALILSGCAGINRNNNPFAHMGDGLINASQRPLPKNYYCTKDVWGGYDCR